MMFCILFLSGCYTDYQLEYAEEDGYDAGYDDGYAAGYDDGYNDGYRVNGGDDGLVIPDNYDAGYQTGYDFGYEDGYNEAEELYEENHLSLVEALFLLYDNDVLDKNIMKLFLEYYWAEQVVGDYFFQNGCYHKANCTELNVDASDFRFYQWEPDIEDAKCPICFNESVKEKE
jgi:hypothetical protein